MSTNCAQICLPAAGNQLFLVCSYPQMMQMPGTMQGMPSVYNNEESGTPKFGNNLNVTNQLRNNKEFKREKNIESLKLSKDKKYFHLLQPYKHERIKDEDEMFQKITYTYVCKYDECNKVFSKACNFLDHVRMHEGIKPYQCTQCGKEFVQKCNLRKHFKKHQAVSLNDRKVFKCFECGKGFTERYNLKVSSELNWLNTGCRKTINFP